MYLILDTLKMQKGQLVRACLRDHPRFVCHLTPIHSSWMNQLELWFSILQCKRGVSATSLDLDHMAERVMVTVSQWHAHGAHGQSCNWSTQSEALVMAKCARAAVYVLAA